jgi:hypothetical protein
MCIRNATYLRLYPKYFFMGKAKKRVNPKVTCRTNRQFKKRYTEELLKVIDKLPPPWKVNKTGRPLHDPKVVAVLCAYMVAFQLTYEGIESELWLIGGTIMEHFGIDKLPGHSVVHRGDDASADEVHTKAE